MQLHSRHYVRGGAGGHVDAAALHRLEHTMDLRTLSGRSRLTHSWEFRVSGVANFVPFIVRTIRGANRAYSNADRIKTTVQEVLNFG
jgi:hypothetical protein